MTVETKQPDRPVSPFVEPWQPTQRAVIITVVAVTLVILLSAMTFVVQRIWYTPESPVDGYFRALADRDADKASSYLTGDDSSATAAILTSEQYVAPTDLKVQGIEDDSDDGKRRTAKVSYAIGDTKKTGEVSLRRSEELSFGLFRGWSISESRPSLEITTSAPIAVQVNGATLEADPEQSLRATVFPGRYVVDVADNPLLETDPVTVDVGFDDAEANLVTRIKETAQAEVDKQIKEYLKGCLVEATKPEHNCPFSMGYSDITRPVWRIDKYPTIELKLGSRGQIVAESTADGQATLTGKGYGGTPYADSTPFDLSGGVTVEQGKVVFLPD
ncbi:zinc ribbon domain-containing protein [Kribbella sancticallisti]|uniref:Zinc ribbon domain-containing protein n=1 Tax=Kribbella sancticallisti TaxID=460087 RepID=A0ABN2EE11_9ACTN